MAAEGDERGTDSPRIWQALLEARRHDFEHSPSLKHPMAGGDLTLHRSGRWDASIPLDALEIAMLEVLAPLATARQITIGQLGQSLDGRIATRTGHSQYINGPVALAHLHRLRALVDAVVIGVGTACADRPRLTVRNVSGPDPVPVVIDPKGRVPMSGPLFEKQAEEGRLLHLIATDADPAPAPGHVERVRMETENGGFPPAGIVSALHERGLRRVLVEGGADAISRFVDADALDRVHLLIAPLIIGSGRNGLDLAAIDRLDEARRPPIRSYALGNELLVDVDLASLRP